MDSDSGTDDLGAFMYLLATSAPIRGVTVSSNGWSNQWTGLVNIQRVMQQFNCDDVELAYGRTPGYTILGGNEIGQSTNLTLFDGAHYPNQPPQEYVINEDGVFTNDCVGFRWGITPRITWPYSSKDLLYNAIKSDPEGKTDLLMLGTYTNVNELIQDDPTILEDIGMITISGGYGAFDGLGDYNVSDVEVCRHIMYNTKSMYLCN